MLTTSPTSTHSLPSTDPDLDLDQTATGLAKKVSAGELSEAQARMQIYETVYASGILRTEALRWCRRSRVPMYLRENLVEAVEHFYMLKILDLPTESAAQKGATDSTNRNGMKFFDLSHFAAGASAAGSIRQALSDYTLMNNTLYRKTRLHADNVVTSTDLLEGNVSPGDGVSGLLSEMPLLEDQGLKEVVEGRREEHISNLHQAREVKLHGKRGVSRLTVDALTVRQCFDLPELERPLDPDERQRILQWVQQDSTLALRSVSALLHPVIDPRAHAMGQLWVSYSQQDLETVASHEYREQIATLLVTDAMSDRPRPGKPVINRARKTVKTKVADCGLDAMWASRLVECYMTHEHEPHSAWDTEPSATSSRRDTVQYLAALDEAARLEGAPLGSTPAEVRGSIIDALAHAQASPAARRARRAA